MKTILAALLALFCTTGVFADAVVGSAAPDFTLVSSTGEDVSLSDYQGTPVVLEWSNHQCPYVRKHYGSGNMQRTQAAITKDGAVWLTILSSAPGKQGHVDGEQAQRLSAERGTYESLVLLDPTGAVGRTYGAKTTPQMALINEAGTLLYWGAIDDKPSANPKSLNGATNYLKQAWDQFKAGDTITPSQTKPYGCTVKYADE